MRRLLLYGALGGVLLALLELIEYQHMVRAYPGEVYGGLIAVLFAAVGIALGRRWTRPREVVRVREVPVPVPAEPFVLDEAKLRELAITPREHQILGLIAAGLSNREIGERLFVSENTVKTHAARLFDKLGARRRVQAVERARELRLVPLTAPPPAASGGRRKDDFGGTAAESPERMTTGSGRRG